jgi:hypothetical protein
MRQQELNRSRKRRAIHGLKLRHQFAVLLCQAHAIPSTPPSTPSPLAALATLLAMRPLPYNMAAPFNPASRISFLAVEKRVSGFHVQNEILAIIHRLPPPRNRSKRCPKNPSKHLIQFGFLRCI